MFEVTIKVSGPGGVIDFEGELVIRALQQVGLDVVVTSNHPIGLAESSETADEMIDRRIKLLQTMREQGKPPEKVRVVLDHQPWGG